MVNTQAQSSSPPSSPDNPDPPDASPTPTTSRLSRWLTHLPFSTPSLLTPDYIELSAGPEQKCFSVHKNLLTTKASHFADGLRGGSYREAQEKRFELPDVEGDVIAAFSGWLYKDNLAQISEDTTDSFDVTIRLYEFADRINLATLQNACLDHVKNIVTKTNWTPKWREIAAHYENSVPADMMRKLLVDLMAWSFMSSKQANVRSTLRDGLLNEDFVVDLFFRINEEGTTAGQALKPVRPKEWYHIQPKSPPTSAAVVGPVAPHAN